MRRDISSRCSAGLCIGNFFPFVAARMKEAIRPELYIKTAIVILGGFLGVTAAEQLGLATSVMFRGLCAIVEAYLIYWALVYYIARRYFGFSREWAAPLASGISICGVSAAIATGSAIKARPVVPVMVSSLVVIFAVLEMLLLPFLAQTFLYSEPMVAGAWMGLAVKTDGAAVTSGAITDALIRAKARRRTASPTGGLDHGRDRHGEGLHRCLHRHLGVRAGLDLVGQDRARGEKVRARDIWERFPKFVLGYAATFAAVLAIGLLAPGAGSEGQSGDGAGRRLPRNLLRDDLLHHRPGLELPQIVGGRHRPAGAGVRPVPVRLHHLDRPGDFVDLLPRGQAAAAYKGPWKNPS